MTSWRLGGLADRRRATERLADDDASLAERLADGAGELVRHGIPPETEAAAFFVPGRIELLGKHTDYAGGRGLVAATAQGLCLVATRRADGVLRLDDVTRERSLAAKIAPDAAPPEDHWTRCPLTVARRLAADFRPRLSGAHIALSSDLPGAAGLGGSSACIIAVYLALARFGGLEARSDYRAAISGIEDLAAYLSCVEHGTSFGEAGVTSPGAQDHTAILCSEAGWLRQYGYRPSRLERAVPMPRGQLFAVAASGVADGKRGETRDRYDRLARLANRAAEVWRRSTGRDEPHLGAVVEATSNAVPWLRKLLKVPDDNDVSGAALEARFEHFVAESSEIVPAAADALERSDLLSLGRLVDHSQQLAEQLLGNQVPETVFLARAARQLGATAASSFGAGFGGGVWALIPVEGAREWLASWAERYALHYPDRADAAAFLLTGPGAAAHEILPADGS